jgi:hypothetical protein
MSVRMLLMLKVCGCGRMCVWMGGGGAPCIHSSMRSFRARFGLAVAVGPGVLLLQDSLNLLNV